MFLIKKIFTLPDIMLDTAIDYCNEQLGKQTLKIESIESGIGYSSESEDNSSSDDSVTRKKLSDSCLIQFHVFVPAELLAKSFQVGIVSSLVNWDVSKMKVLATDSKYKGGLLATGAIKVPTKTTNFEYKYVLKDLENGGIKWEALLNNKNRLCNVEQRHGYKEHFNKYDGILLPQENTQLFFDQYKNDVISLMVSELIDDKKKLKTLESTLKELDTICSDLKAVFDCNTVEINNKICEALLEVLKEKNDSKLSLLLATAVLWKRKDFGPECLSQDNLESMLSILL